ncbi:Glycolipid transfer protein 3 [Hibiscus syriacus]|uniref:Glycolipid transfer protein 3 n=1 Tax=Hibiscus syriacus TaxID=106335 RepID=A0A6A3ANZ8_HIBSY|nr:Glycolipid transfer protein 3 [Hibiscus syriacus]
MKGSIYLNCLELPCGFGSSVGRRASMVEERVLGRGEEEGAEEDRMTVGRLEILLESDPTKYSNMIGMLKKEESEGNARKGSSCSKAFPWLTSFTLPKHALDTNSKQRSMDFMVALLQRLVREPEQNMEQAVQESYNVTLKPRHGWISSAAFKRFYRLDRLKSS